MRFLMVLVGGAIVMLAQYRTRKPFRGRIIMAAILLLMLCSQAIPWKPVFAFEKRVSRQPGVANEIGLAWPPHIVQAEDPISAGRFELWMPLGNHNPNDGVPTLLPLSVEVP